MNLESLPAGALPAFVIALAVLVLAVALRSVSGGRVEIRLADAATATIPIVLWLVMSGQIAKLSVGAEGITVEPAAKAILAASTRPIGGQVTALPVAPVEIALKGPVSAIPDLVRRETQAINLIFGHGGYVPQALDEYLTTLAKYPFFRYVIFANPDNTLFGMIDGRKLATLVDTRSVGVDWGDFATILNRGGPPERERIARLPGFVPAANAVGRSADKRQVLERMEKLGVEWLPVTGENRRFEGVVERSRLTASLILDVSAQLSAVK